MLYNTEEFEANRTTAPYRGVRGFSAQYWQWPHSMRSRVYVTVRCPSVCLSVCPFVCPICPLQQRAAGLLLWARRAIDCCTVGAAASRRAAANADSVTFTVDVRSRPQTCSFYGNSVNFEAFFIRSSCLSDCILFLLRRPRPRLNA